MKFCIVGLGQFGRSLAVELASEGHDVLAIDSSDRLVDSVKDKVTMAARTDATSFEDLEALGMARMDVGIVAIGEDFAASLTVAAHMQKLKVKSIHCRVINEVHDHILDLMQITEKIQPEMMAARQFAKRLGINRAARHFALGEDYSIVELAAPKVVVGKTLAEANLRGKHRLNLVTARCAGEDGQPHIMGVPDPNYRFGENDTLIVFGREADIRRFADR
jgi:trk system potassium uptake protein TrkA